MSIHKILMASMMAIATSAFLTACSDDDDNNDNGNPASLNANCNKGNVNPYTRGLEFPRLHEGNDTVISHTTIENGRTTLNYSYEWAIDKRSQRWSCYYMTKDYTGNVGRYEGGYPNDPQLPARYYTFSKDDPFKSSGYDHGHICPSADRQYSYEANKQTFYLPNMQPQIHIFNASMWGDMENRVRKWVPTNSTDTLFVCRGGTIDSEENIIKRINGELIVPKYFFMAMLLKKWNTDKKEYEYQALGFWIEHMSQKPSGYDSKNYVVTIDDLERKTGIDFFCNLPDDIENKVEAVTYAQSWSWK